MVKYLYDISKGTCSTGLETGCKPILLLQDVGYDADWVLEEGGSVSRLQKTCHWTCRGSGRKKSNLNQLYPDF